jgi:hypothetical protein
VVRKPLEEQLFLRPRRKGENNIQIANENNCDRGNWLDIISSGEFSY